MKAYTVDLVRPGTEANAAFAPASSYQYQDTLFREVHNIRDWLPWSIINILMGGIPIGLIPLVFSLLCRSSKKKNDVDGARTMSNLALVLNIIITALSSFGLGFLTCYLIYFRRIINLI
jgi:hypothetical protein